MYNQTPPESTGDFTMSPPSTNGPTTPANVANIFPTPIGIYVNDDHSKTKKVLMEMMKDAPSQKNDISPSLIHYFDDNDSVLIKNKLESFRKWVEEKALIFAKDVLGYSIDELNVTDSWLNVSNEGAFQQPHMHINSFISGTYYVNMNKNHSPLFFIHPRNQNFLNVSQSVISVDCNKENIYQTDVPVSPIEGSLVLWESHLSHGYPPTQGNNRISLSMNFMPSTVKGGRYSFKTVRR